MTTFQTVLADVFVRGAERRFTDPVEEREAIRAAKAGDEAATIALVYAYAPTLRDVVSRYRYASTPAVWDGSTVGDPIEADEARQGAVLGLLEAIQAFDPAIHDRLAGIVAPYVTQAASEAMAGAIALTVPTRTANRFFGIVRRAGGDLEKAADLAQTYEMSREAFWAVAAAVGADRIEGSALSDDGASRIESARGLWGEEDGIADAEDRILCEVAFSAVGDLEKDVTRAAYGFSSYRPKSDAEIAGDFGMSRPTVQRTRTGALVKMRDRLAVDVEA